MINLFSVVIGGILFFSVCFYITLYGVDVKRSHYHYRAGYFFIGGCVLLNFWLIQQPMEDSWVIVVVFWIIWSICFIDYYFLMIPKHYAYGVMMCGFVYWGTNHTASYENVVSAMTLWLFYLFIYLYYLWRKKKSVIGFGDVRLACFLGMWFPIGDVPQFLFVSALMGIILGGGKLLFTRSIRKNIPYGPCLCFSAMILVIPPHL